MLSLVSKIQYENGLVLIPGSANNPNKIQKVYLTIGDMAVTDNNAADVFVGTENEGKVSFTPASSTNGNVNILSLNGASLEGNIISGVGDLKIVIQGESYNQKNCTSSHRNHCYSYSSPIRYHISNN